MPTAAKAEVVYLKGVGPKRAEAFGKLGIKYVSDLLNIYPRDYLIRTNICDLKSFIDKNVLIIAEIVDRQQPRKPNHPLKIILRDNTGSFTCLIWGNYFYRERQFNTGDKFLFWIKVSRNPYDKSLNFDYRDHKRYESSDDELLKYPVIPLYILPTELKKTWIKPLTLTKIVFNAIKKESKSIEEILPASLLGKYKLTDHKSAVLRLHYPLKLSDTDSSRQTLAFEELFFLQLILALKKYNIKSSVSGISFENIGERLEKLFKEYLNFELTDAQKRVIRELRSDMKESKPMNRLLQGDVGSGKTIVAIFAMLIAIENGYQCAFMCPTEILAEQHYKVLKSYFDKLGVKTSLLVGGQKKKLREQILQDIRLHNTDVITGTHALIQDNVEFKKLGFIVIDEQHKFGVMQRARLKEKSIGNNLNPDVLVMTATPIPRTLSLTIYGDLDVSVIDELPKNRKPVKTAIRTESDRLNVYKFIRDEIKNGRQAYIVYPIIEESEKLDIKSAIKHYEILKMEIFPDLIIGLVHGKLFWYEIDETIEDFKNKKIDILVTTTVIEVGIDIPNATVMLIEEAQRFGLSQLHQLRGRVGRGAEQSYCILMTDDRLSDESKLRLNTMVETTDGFKISEIDMSIRGPGEFFGTKQSGELKFTAADLTKDKNLLLQAREAAFKIVDDDPHLRDKSNESIHKYFINNYKDSLKLINIA